MGDPGSGGEIVEQVIRPTGLLDPKIEVRPASGQVDDVLAEIHSHTKKGGRVLVTTLTKRLAEEITKYLVELNVKAKYLHSDIDTIERVQIIRDLRAGILMFWSASTCCVRDWISPKSRWWRS